jgi:hypothetical protein
MFACPQWPIFSYSGVCPTGTAPGNNTYGLIHDMGVNNGVV